MEAVVRSLLRFLRNDGGATAIEYGLICAIMSIVVVTSFPAVWESASGVFQTISDAFATALDAEAAQ